MTELTMTQFRKDMFRVADRALETGEPVRIRRGGRVLELRPMEPDKPRTPQEWWAHYLKTSSLPCADDRELSKEELQEEVRRLSVSDEDWMDEWLEERHLYE